MAATKDDVAGTLLDLQVAWAIGEVTGDRLAPVLERDVDELLAVAARHKVADVVDREAVKLTARRIVEISGASEIVADLAVEFAAVLHQLPAASDHTPADVVDRAAVKALVAKFLSMHRLQERALDRLTESPLVATIASTFVTKIVGDFLQQNRERAEKLPGMSSLFSLGSGAVSRVRSVTDKHVDALLGDAAGKGAQFAIRRTNAAIHDLVRDAPLQAAAMEMWDLHADEPISELRKYLTAKDAREIAALVHDLLAGARESEYVGLALDACVDAFFDRYGDHDVAALISEAGISRDDLVTTVVRHAPPVLDALHRSGELDTIIRSRLEPFFRSAEVRTLLAQD